MAIRKDGVDTYRKLLKAASEVFAEKGYRDTTVAEICRRAHSNVAAVNYHFDSKDELYIAVLKNAFGEALRVYPPDGGLPAEAPAEERLGALIHSVLHRILDDGRLGCAGQILLREMADPIETFRRVHEDIVRPLREIMLGIIRDLIGPDATEQQIVFCVMSVIHQCLAIGFRKGRGHLPSFLDSPQSTTETIDALAEHITLFSLAGLSAVREKIEAAFSS
ncbi:MAG: CerR family C-terminal domain-containing protein [Desulfobulbus sp.]|nr:CerR family C-terminal domain-containing protein [Desulfobulbus sp.]